MARRGHGVTVIAGYSGQELRKEFVEENDSKNGGSLGTTNEYIDGQ